MLVSRIKKISPENENIKKIMLFDEKFSKKDMDMLEEGFSISKETIDKSKAIYRNVGIVAELGKMDNLDSSWKFFLEKKFPKKLEFSKLDNFFINDHYDEVLIITNRRLMMVDIKRLNEKLEILNAEIEIFNDKIKENMKHEKISVMSRIKGMFG